MPQANEPSPLDQLFNSKTPLEAGMDFLQKHWFLVLVVLCTVVSAGLQYRAGLIGDRMSDSLDRQAEQTSQTIARIDTFNEEQKEALRTSFKVGPLPPTPELGNPPDVGPIPPLVRLPDGRLDVRQRMQFVVENNPIPGVAALNKAIVAGDVSINTQPDAGAYAAFTLIPSWMVASVEGGTRGRNMLPTFQFDPAKLGQMDTKAKVLEAMIVVYHESVHYQQFLRATTAEQIASFAPRSTESKNSVKECERWWANEFEAYSLECEAALSWGITDTAGELCLHMSDSVSFKTYFFVMMGNEMYGQNAPECLATWARIAGHPHPEAYE